MKPRYTILLAGLITLTLRAAPADNASQAPGPAAEARAFKKIDEGRDHRLWASERVETDEHGKVHTVTHSYIELETGMNFRKGGVWVPSRERIELTESNAVALEGNHQAFFAPNVNTIGALDLLTSDGKRLRSRILGLAYFDWKTNRSVLIAELKDSVGLLVGDNQVIYTNAFTDFRADVRYTYTKAGVEQDIILRERPPLPEEYGLDPASTRLEVWTEFFDPPEPMVDEQVRKGWKKSKVARSISFGEMKIGQGIAFGIGQGAEKRTGVTVEKRWEKIEDRYFLVEELPFKWVVPQLRALGARQQAAVDRPGDSLRHRVSEKRLLPAVKVASAGALDRFQLAALDGQAGGFVIDYAIVTSQDNYTFKSDTTYYVTNVVNLGGVTTIEGGTVIKYARGGEINVLGTIACSTAPYRPAILTAVDDNSVGELIGTNTLTGTYAEVALALTYSAELNYLNIRYAKEAVYAPQNLTIRNSQLVHGNRGLHAEYSTVNAFNVLMYDVRTNFYGSFFHAHGEHLTLDLESQITDDWNFFLSDGCGGETPSSWVELVNTLVTQDSATNEIVPIYPTQVVNLGTGGANIYQTVGAGSHYLVGSSYRDIGVSWIDSTLAADLALKTTYAPLVLSNVVFSANTNLSRTIARDTNAPDLGYHYDPIDYAMCLVTVGQGTTTTITNGAVIAGFGSGPFILSTNSTLVSGGNPLRHNYLLRYHAVQENAAAWGSNSTFSIWNVLDPSVQVQLRFSELIFLGGTNAGRNLFIGKAPGLLAFNDSQVWGGSFTYGPSTIGNSFRAQNTLFYRTAATIWDGEDKDLGEVGIYVEFYNDLWIGGSLYTLHDTQAEGSAWVIFNSMWDHVSLTAYGNYNIANHHNAYFSATVFPGSAGSDQILTNFVYATGPLGRFYQASTSLVNLGYLSAGNWGLYHYTTSTNQVKETNSIVDIGLHYLVLDNDGTVMDSDADGIPDYIEDANGNGTVNNGETDWVAHCLAAPQGLVGWWRAEGNLSDSGGTNNNGSAPYGITYGPGRVGQAFVHNGSQKVTIPDNDSLKLTNSLTIEGWVVVQGSGFIVMRGDSRPGLDPYALTLDNSGKLSFLITAASGAAVQLFSPSPLTMGRWTHVAATLNGATGEMRLYVDGLTVAQTNTTLRPLRDLNAAYGPGVGIGGHPGTYNYFPFHGRIDEIAIFNRALSSSEIASLRSSGIAGICPLPPAIVTQPANQIVALGGSAMFNVVATGNAPLSYQWRLNGANVSGATASSLTLNNLQAANYGNYAVVITNNYGSVTSITVTLTRPCSAIPSGLVAWWAAEQDARDSFSTNHGTLLNGAGFTNGTVGKAFSFNGSNQKVTLPDYDAFKLTNSLSIEGWVYVQGSGFVFFRGDTRAGLDPYVVTIEANGKLQLLITAASGASVTLQSAAVVPTNTWKHVVASLDGSSGTMRLWIDAVVVGQTNTTLRPLRDLNASYSPGIGIGGHSGGYAAFPFHGFIDEISLYNRALTTNEVQSIYNAGPTGKCPVPPTILIQPTNQTVTVGNNALFTVFATGSALSYQWRLNGNAVAGATRSSLLLTNVQQTDFRSYSVVVSNTVGWVVSDDAFLTIAPASCAAVPSGLLGWWSAEANGFDNLGGNPGTMVGGSYVAGKVGQAFNFNALGAGVKLGRPADLERQNFTIETWVQRNNATTICLNANNSVMFSYGFGGYGFGMWDNGSLFLTRIGIDNTTTSVGIQDTAWHHVAVTKNGTTVVFYIDGSPINVGPYYSTFTFWTEVAIGARGDNMANGFLGSLDEMAVYDHALSASEIRAIYTASLAGKCALPPASPTIVTQPASQTVLLGSPATFSVSAVGTPLLTYQWFMNGQRIVNATNAVLSFSSVALTNSGAYSVVVENNLGAVWSEEAVLTVDPVPVTTVWVEDTVPSGAIQTGNNEGWNWTDYWYDGDGWWGEEVYPNSGSYMHMSSFVSWDMHQHYFYGASTPLHIYPGDTLFAYVNMDSAYPPQQVMLQWRDTSGNWYRAYWGDDYIGWPATYMGPLPYAGQWVRLEVPASAVGLEGLNIDGMAFTLFDGRAAWDSAGTTNSDDSDHNHISDIWERQYFGVNGIDPQADPDGDGLTNLQEYQRGTNPTNPDTDYDGRSDGEEFLEGTDPLNRASHVPVFLSTWSFEPPHSQSFFGGTNGSTNVFLGDQGQAPLAATNVLIVAGTNGNAVLISSNNPARLAYRDVEQTGTANFNANEGTVRFWVALTSGSGSGTQGRLLEMGSRGNGWWALVLNSTATQISFQTGTNSNPTTNLTASISWAANKWHQIALTYSPTNSSLYIDGSAVVTNGTGVQAFPSAAERAQSGLNFGSTTNGTLQAKGSFDQVETFSAPLSGTSISSRFAAGMSEVNTCDLYPIAIHVSALATGISSPGVDTGNFGWIDWDGKSPNEPELEHALTHPEDSRNYNIDGDRVLNIGDPVFGSTGVKHSVSDALEYLKVNQIVMTVPVWSEPPQGQGQGYRYKVQSFANIILLDYSFRHGVTLYFTNLGPAQCNCPVPTTATPLTDLNLCPGGSGSFSTVASGTPPVTFVWRKNGALLSGKTTDTLTLTAVTAADAGTYCVEVTGGCGSVTNCATLTLKTKTATSPLTPLVLCPGANGEFCTIASGTGPFTYIWKKNGAVLSGQTGSCLALNNVSGANVGTYCVEVTGACGSATNCATLTLSTLTTSTPLQSLTLCVGGSGCFSNFPSGTGPFTYTWTWNGVALPGQTGATLCFTNVSLTNAGTYCVLVQGACNRVTNCATLVVTSTAATPLTPRTVGVGASVTFSTTASGGGPYSYRWTKDRVTINGQTANTLVLNNLTQGDAGDYCVEVTGACNSVTNCATLSVTNAGNVPPTIVLPGPTPAYVENDPPKILDPGAYVTDPDSPDFNGGQLTINFSVNGVPEDRLIIRNQGNAPGQISTEGNQVKYQGLVFGTFSGGYVAAPLVVNFTSVSATHNAVGALLQNIQYWNTSDNPSTLTRTVQFQMTDGDGGTSLPVTKQVTVARVNDPPVANPQIVRVFKDTPKAITLTGFDLDNDPLTFTVVTSPTHGGITTGSGPDRTYTPNGGYTGPDSFTFKVYDGTVYSAEATVGINVVSNQPLAVDAGPDKNGVTGEFIHLDGVIITDHFPPDSSITSQWTVDSQPTGSQVIFRDANAPATTASFSAVGTYVVRLTADDGSGPVSDTATVTICSVQEKPGDIVLVLDHSGSMDTTWPGSISAAKGLLDLINPASHQVSVLTFEGIGTLESPLTRDFNSLKTLLDALPVPDGSTEIASGVALAMGELSSVRHVAGADRIMIVISDGFDNDWPGSRSAEEMANIAKHQGVRVVTIGLPKPPCQTEDCVLAELLKGMASSDGDYHFAPTAGDLPGIYAGLIHQICLGYQRPFVDAGFDQDKLPTATVNLAASVYGGYGQDFGTPTFAWMQIGDPNGMFDLDNPPPATITFVTSPNAAATSFRINDQNLLGPYTLRCTASFPNGETAVFDDVVITISDPASTGYPPTAVPDFMVVNENSINNVVPVLDNDRDVEAGSVLTIQAVSTPDNGGTAVITDNGTKISYTPAQNFRGLEKFTYDVMDSDNNVASAEVQIYVYHINEPPMARDDSYQVDAAATTPVQLLPGVLDNDTDPEGSTLVISSTGPASHGTVSVQFARLVSYLPQGGYVGPDSFTYTIKDEQGGTSTATVHIDVMVVPNLPPKAVDDTGTLNIAIGNTLDLNVLGNDLDPNNNTLTITGNSTPAHGTATVTDDGFGNFFIRYVRTDTSYTGRDTFTYTISDGQGGTASATVRIAIVDYANNHEPIGGITKIANTTDDTPIVRDGRLNVEGFADDPADPNDGIEYTLTVSPFDPVSGQILDGPTASLESFSRVTSGSLGTLDLSFLPDGFYIVELDVSDGVSSAQPDFKTFILQSQLKIGQVAFSVTDMNLKLKGLPLSFVRSYNSSKPGSGDFSPGWEMAVNSVKIYKNMSLGEAWGGQQQLGYTIYDAGPHIVSIIFPEGKKYQFYASAPGTWADADSALVTIHFDPLPGTPSQCTLVAPAATGLTVMPNPGTTGPILLSDDDGATVFDSNDFNFTTPDGTEYDFSNGQIVRIKDRNNNTLTFTPNGIDHSSDGGTTTDRSVTIERDSNNQNRIVALYNPKYPAPNGPPAVKYEYDGNNRLTIVRKLTDASNPDRPVYSSVTYLYESPNPQQLNFITKIKDGLGLSIMRNEYDDDGRLTATIDAENHRTRFIHDVANHTETIIDPLEHTTVHVFDDRGNVLTTIDARQKTHSATFDAHNNKKSETDPLLRTTGHDYTYYKSSGVETDIIQKQVVTHPHPAGLPDTDFQTTLEYNEQGQVTSVTDPKGHTKQFAYVDGTETPASDYIAALGKMKSYTDTEQKTTTYKYPLNQQVVTDPQLNVTTYTFDNFGNTISIEKRDSANVLLSANTYTYDPNGNRSTETTSRALPNGTDREITSVTFIYDDADRQTGMTATVQTVDSNGDGVPPYPTPTAVPSTQPTVEYDDDGRPKVMSRERKMTDGTTQTSLVKYEYDPRGNLTRITYDDETYDESIYGPDGRLASSRDRSGRTTTYTYNETGNLVQTVYPDHINYSSNYFDDAGQLLAATDARGFTTSYRYDEMGRQKEVTDALNHTTYFTYDNAGNQTTFRTPAGITTFVYDDLNRRTNTVYPDGTTRQIVYDELDQETMEVDQAGVIKEFGYDGQGRLTRVTAALGDPNEITTQFDYDENDQLVQITDAAAHVTKFEYDNFGRKTKRTLPDSTSQETFEYYPDNLGLLKKHTDFRTRVTTYEYDLQGRILKRVPDGGETAIEFTYNDVGQRETMSDASGLTTYRYLDGKLWKKVTPNGTLTYTYDENGNVTTIDSSTANGVSITYKWDAANRLKQVIDNRTGGTTTYEYDDPGNLKTIAYPNTTLTTYHYNSLNRLTDMSVTKGGATLATFDYNPNEAGRTIGPAGNRRAARETINVTATSVIQRNINYDYDALYRLTSEQISLGGGNNVAGLAAGSIIHDATPGYGDLTSGLGIDQAGNHRSRTLQSANSALANKVTQFNHRNFDVNDRIDPNSNPTDANPDYDLNGNTLNGEVTPTQSTADQYDINNRLITRHTTLGGQAATIALVYDGEGNRVRKTVTIGASVNVTNYLVDSVNPSGNAQVLEELVSVNGGAVFRDRSYVYGHTLISQRQAAGTTHYYGYDGHGSVRFLMSDTGQMTDAYNYEAFGILLDEWHFGTATPNKYLFSGEQYDSDLGLYYLRARYLNPNNGRFWTMDSLDGIKSDPLSLHKYLYCQGDPVNRVDPSGNESLIGVSIATTISMSLEAIYNGVVGAVGTALRMTIFGVEAGKSATDILKEFVFDQTGIQDILDMAEAADDAFTAVKAWLLGHGATQEMAYGPMFYSEYDAFALPMIIPMDSALEQFNEEQESVGQCLRGDMLVASAIGLRRIDTLAEGDWVWAWNEEDATRELREVLGISTNTCSEIFEIEVAGETIFATQDHLFFLNNALWKNACDLAVGDILFDENNPAGRVILSVMRHDQGCRVYNIEVEGLHNFFVTDEGILTHNGLLKAGYNHFFMRSFQKAINLEHALGYGERVLNWQRKMNAREHTMYHRLLNAHLKKNGMLPGPGNSSTKIFKRLSKTMGEKAAREHIIETFRKFYKEEFPKGKKIFEQELRAFRRGDQVIPPLP